MLSTNPFKVWIARPKLSELYNGSPWTLAGIGATTYKIKSQWASTVRKLNISLATGSWVFILDREKIMEQRGNLNSWDTTGGLPTKWRDPLWLDSCKRPSPVSDHSVFAFWVVAYGRFDCTLLWLRATGWKILCYQLPRFLESLRLSLSKSGILFLKNK